MTIFGVDFDSSPAEWCRAILPAVEEHHGRYSHVPPVSALEVYGTELTEELLVELAALGFVRVEAMPGGWRVSSRSLSGKRFWRERDSSRIWSRSRRRTALVSTFCSVRAWIRSRSADPSSSRDYESSSWTSRSRRSGSASASLKPALASPITSS